MDLAVEMDVVQKSGSWFSMGEERIGQGKDSVKAYLMANPDIAESVEAKVRANLMKRVAAMSGRPVSQDDDEYIDED